MRLTVHYFLFACPRHLCRMAGIYVAWPSFTSRLLPPALPHLPLPRCPTPRHCPSHHRRPPHPPPPPAPAPPPPPRLYCLQYHKDTKSDAELIDQPSHFTHQSQGNNLCQRHLKPPDTVQQSASVPWLRSNSRRILRCFRRCSPLISRSIASRFASSSFSASSVLPWVRIVS